MEHIDRPTDPGPMSQDVFSATWQQMRGTLRAWWGKLSDDDWERLGGQKDRLIRMLQDQYGYATEMAVREVNRRFQEYRDTAHTAGHDLKIAGQEIAPSVAETYADAHAKVQELSAGAAEKIGKATTTAEEQRRSVAGTIRANAPQEGTIESAANTVVNHFEDAGAYVHGTTLEDMARDLTGLVRRNPLQALLIGLGIGYWCARRLER